MPICLGNPPCFKARKTPWRRSSRRPKDARNSWSWGCRSRCGTACSTARRHRRQRLLGVVPKRFLPNYKEFYETRWFSPATGREPKTIVLAGQDAPFGIDLLFEATRDVVVGIEICEDLWMPIPPSSTQALAGATVLLNLSASNETVGKRRYRTDLVVGQSGRCLAAYAYAGAGPSESTTDLVFGGHCLIAENGRLLVESRRVGDGGPPPLEAHTITVDVDVDRLAADRRATTTFDDASRFPAEYRRLPFRLAEALPGLKRDVAGMPFVPVEGAELHDRFAEIFGIQCAGLAPRVGQLPAATPLHIGVSGGLDSTLALLVAAKTCDALGWPRSTIRGLTMPGFGTTSRTLTNALALMDHLGVGVETIDITELALRVPGVEPRSLRHRLSNLERIGISIGAVRNPARTAARPHFRERPGTLAHVPVDVARVRHRHGRSLRTGARLVDL